METQAIGLNAARAPSVGESPSRYTIFKGNGFLEGIVKVTLVVCALVCTYFSCGILFAQPPGRVEQENNEIELLEHELDQFFKDKDELYEPKFRYADYNENKSNYDFDRKKTLLENLKKLHQAKCAILSSSCTSQAKKKHEANIAKLRTLIINSFSSR